MSTIEYLLTGLSTWLIWLSVWLYLRMRYYRKKYRRNQYMINRVLISMGMFINKKEAGRPQADFGENYWFIKQIYSRLTRYVTRHHPVYDKTHRYKGERAPKNKDR